MGYLHFNSLSFSRKVSISSIKTKLEYRWRSYLPLLRTWHCVPTLFHSGSPVLCTPHWPVWGSPHHHTRCPTCCCAAPPRGPRAAPLQSSPPDALLRLERVTPCAERLSFSGVQPEHRWRGGGGGSWSRRHGSSWLGGGGGGLKVETGTILQYFSTSNEVQANYIVFTFLLLHVHAVSSAVRLPPAVIFPLSLSCCCFEHFSLEIFIGERRRRCL